MSLEHHRKLPMVDLVGQYNEIKDEIQEAIISTIESSAFINGPAVKSFASELSNFTGSKYVVPCGNGTDALQIALMALDLSPGDEVIVPSFTYIATVEVISLLNLTPVFVDVDPRTFNLDSTHLKKTISPKTKAIIAVHLFGQCADMESILSIANNNSLAVIEDNAQSLGAEYTFTDGSTQSSGTMGKIATTSFFPSKNLGAFGDGGAMMTEDEDISKTIHSIANHGQIKKYFHEVVGVNSRLDTLQAAILSVKLKYLPSYASKRQKVAEIYDERLANIPELQTPFKEPQSTHVYHQYTLKVSAEVREKFRSYLSDHGIPSMIYYPLPQHLQNAYLKYGHKEGDFPVSELLCKQVVSIPIHTQMKEDDIDYICTTINNFFDN